MRTFFSFFTLAVVSIPVFVFAQEKVYSPLVSVAGNDAMSFEQYINFLYGMSISIAALLAVVKIVVAGAKYMLSDVINTKGEAIKDIQGAILGLLLIIGAVVILELINPTLVDKEIRFNDFQSERGSLREPALGVANLDANGNVTTGANECQAGRPIVMPGQQASTYTQLNRSYTVLNSDTCSYVSTPRAYCQETAGGRMTKVEIPMGTDNPILHDSYIPMTDGEGLLLCMEEIETDMRRFCFNNSGKFAEHTEGGVLAYACQLPERNLGVNQLLEEFEIYKQRILDEPEPESLADLAEYNSRQERIRNLTAPNTHEIFSRICGIRQAEEGGVWFIKYSPELGSTDEYPDPDEIDQTDVENYRCVRY